MILENIKSPQDLQDLSIEELKTLSEEIRKRIIDVVSRNGGHLASSLGIVELTLALHRVFHYPQDNIIWDVGHQSYAHKIITGRNEKFDTIRKKGGLSGFPKITESVYDSFNTGHSSTSISAAQGIQIAHELLGQNGKTVAVIGDGALTGGMAFEALNYTGHLRNNLVVVLNDNEMSISENVGAMSMYLHNLRLEPAYTTPKDYLAYILKQMPGFGLKLYRILSRIEGSFKYLLTPGMLFEEFGFKYIGPVSGYDFELLERALNRAKDRQGPVLVHVLTNKGKGYEPAETHANKFHGVGPFEIETGNPATVKKETYTSVFGNKLCELAANNLRIVAITAAMQEGTGLSKFASEYPARFFDVGIAEEHAVTMAAGMAKAGLKPFVAIYSTFIQRAYDQILHDVAMMNLPVTFCLDRAGLVGEDGPTHHGLFDISIFKTIPGLQILAPGDEYELVTMLEYAEKQNSPIMIRYPKNSITGLNKTHSNIEYGKSEVIKDGKDVALWAVGNTLENAIKATEKLEKDGIKVKLINVRFIKPFDKCLLKKLLEEKLPIVTVEENILSGGFGSILAEEALNIGLSFKLHRIGIPDIFVEHGTISELREMLHLDANGIENEIKKFICEK